MKKVEIRAAADGGTVEERVAPERVEQLCLDDDQLAQLNALAAQCEQVYGPARDIEWAFAGGQLYLLQCRAVTRTGSSPRPPTPPVASGAVEAIERVPFFANMSPRDVEGIAALFKERRFVAGETITKEGAGGAAFFVIESGRQPCRSAADERAVLSRRRLLRRDRADRRGRPLGDDHCRTAISCVTGSRTGSSGRSCSRTQPSRGTCCRRWPNDCAPRRTTKRRRSCGDSQAVPSTRAEPRAAPTRSAIAIAAARSRGAKVTPVVVAAGASTNRPRVSPR